MTMMNTLTQISVLSIIALAGCVSNDTVDDIDVNPDVIWGHYHASYSAQSKKVRFRSTLRVGGDTGTTVRLTGGAEIRVDGSKLNVQDGDDALINVIGTYYALEQSAEIPKESYSFTWTRNDGQSFTNVVQQAQSLSIVSPASGAAIDPTQPLTVKLSAPLKDNETAFVDISAGEEYRTQLISAGDTLTFTASELAGLPVGGGLLSLSIRWETNAVEGHPEEGGKLSSTMQGNNVAIEIGGNE